MLAGSLLCLAAVRRNGGVGRPRSLSHPLVLFLSFCLPPSLFRPVRPFRSSLSTFLLRFSSFHFQFSFFDFFVLSPSLQLLFRFFFLIFPRFPLIILKRNYSQHLYIIHSPFHSCIPSPSHQQTLFISPFKFPSLYTLFLSSFSLKYIHSFHAHTRSVPRPFPTSNLLPLFLARPRGTA